MILKHTLEAWAAQIIKQYLCSDKVFKVAYIYLAIFTREFESMKKLSKNTEGNTSSSFLDTAFIANL
jgi:hypothetical protein